MEVVASVSSVTAVVSIAAQLGEGISKLLKFWSDVNNAPKRTSERLNYLKQLDSVLKDTQEQDYAEGSKVVVEEALRNCHIKVSTLVTKISKSEKDRNSPNPITRKLGHLKITYNDEELKEMLSSVRHTYMVLHGAQLNSITSILRQNSILNEKVLYTLQELKHNVTMRVYDSIESCDTKCLLSHNQATHSEVIMRDNKLIQIDKALDCRPVHLSSLKSRRYNADAAISKFRENDHLIYPPWILRTFGVSHGLQIIIRQTAGWQFTLNTFRAVPPNAPIFDFCREGNLLAVQSLLKNGHASSMDRDPFGRTPLWVAAGALQVEIAQLLIREGADCHASGGMNDTLPIDEVNNHTGDYESQVAMLELLQKHCADGYTDLTLRKLIGKFMMAYRPQEVALKLTDAQRWEAIDRIVSHFIQEFEADDPVRAKILYEALEFYFDQQVVHGILRNIPGMLDKTERYEVNANGTRRHLSFLSQAISKQLFKRDPYSIRLIAQKTPDIHVVDWRGSGPWTATATAMRQSSLFFDWRNLLQELGQDNFDQFVERELQSAGPLKAEGWRQQTLRALFDIRGKPHEGKRVFNFPVCERCGSNSVYSMAPVPVDLEWRRALRMIRLGHHVTSYPPSESWSSQDSTESSNLSSMAPKHWPYRIVCAYWCQDGAQLANIYENDTLDEPDLPLYKEKKVITEIKVVEIQDEVERRTKSIPGAFID